MKTTVSIKTIFSFLFLVCVCMCFAVFDSGTAAAATLATLPVVAVFNPDNLKIPQTEFEALKAKYKQIYVLDIEIDATEKYQFYARRPTRETISAVAANKNNLDKANDIIIKNTIVAGDMDALDDGVVYARVLQELAKIIQQGKSFFTKA